MHVVCVNRDRGIDPARQKGAAVHLLAMRSAFRSLGAQVTEIDQPDGQLLRSSLEGLAGGIDLVYERHALGASPAACFARERGVPYVLEVNAPLEEEEARWRPERLAASSPSASSADIDAGGASARGSSARGASAAEGLQDVDLVLAVSAGTAEYAIRRGARPERVRVTPNGVDPERFHPELRDEELRSRFVPAGGFLLGFHGRLRPWHGFERLCGAVAALRAEGRPVHLLTIGVGDFEPLARAAGIAEVHTHVGWCEHDQVGRYVAQYDALALSYDGDEACYFSPLKLAEAMAAGVVPIVPDRGDLAELVRHGETGLVYEPAEAMALERSIARMIDQPAERAAIARSAVAAAQAMTWEQIASDVLATCRERA